MGSLIVNWPKGPMKGYSTWYSYLMEGFKAIGAKVIIDPCLYDPKDESKAPGVIPFTISLPENPNVIHKVWYDISDFVTDYYKEVWRPGDFYFKIQTRKDFELPERFYPIGQTACSVELPSLLPALRHLNWTVEKKHDVIHMCRATAFELRVKAAKILLKMKDIRALVGIAGSLNRPEVPKEVSLRKLPFDQHLIEQAQSKICLALPGVGGDFTWRHTEIMAMGGFLLTIEPDFIQPGSPFDCWGVCKRDLSDLEEAIVHYLFCEKTRLYIAKNGQNYYDQYLGPMAQAQYVIRTIRRALQ